MNKEIRTMIEEYGFKIESRQDHGKNIYYHCINPNTIVEFFLDTQYFKSGINIDYNTINKETYDGNSEVLYLLIIDGNATNIMEILDNKEHKKMNIMIYDPEDDVEFIMKDFWNFIVKIL